MESKINQVPIIGAITFDLARDSGSVCVGHPECELWEEKGTVSDLGEALLSRVDTDSQSEMAEYLERVQRGENLTISPVEIRIGADVTQVGIAATNSDFNRLELTFLDLGDWIAGREVAERSQRVTSTYLRIAEWIEASLSDSESWQHILSEFLAFSENDFGFIGTRELDEAGAPFLRTKSLTNVAWDEETQRLYQESEAAGFEFRNLRALFGPTIERGETVVSRDYENESRGVGIPAGHPPLTSYVGIPINLDRRLVGMVGMAGKPGGCSDDCVSSLLVLMNLLSRDRRFLRLFDEPVEGNTPSDSDSHTYIALMSVMDRIEFPALAIDGDTITWASLEASKLFDCQRGSLLGLNLSKPDNLIGLREENYSQVDPESLDAVMDKSRSSAKDRWVSMPSGARRARRALFYLKYMKVAGHKVYQVIDYTTHAEAMREIQEFARKAADLSQLQSRLVNMISHELRTPLSSLQTSVELLEMNSSKEQGDQLGPYFDNIYHMVGQVTSLIDSVLTFGKITMGQDRIVLHPTKLEHVIEKVLAELQPDLVNRVRIAYSESETDVVLRSDNALLRLVIKNVLSNALKFSDGMVDVTVSSNEAEPDVVSLSFRDQGVGIPPEDLVKVFEPFYRSSNVSLIPGTGIGLALVKGIVMVLKGKLILGSELGGGTTVTINLPKVVL